MRRSFLLVASALVALCACGLTARGLGAADGGALEEGDAGTDGPAGEKDAGGDATVEDADAGPCLVEVEDPFTTTTFDPARWLVIANAANAGLPAPAVIGSTPVAKLVDDTTDNVRGAIWHPQVVPFTAFDISFDAYAICSGACGDGLAIVWLETATAAQLNIAGEGATFGIPNNLSGGAVALDLAKNDAGGDFATPSMSILDINATQAPAQYDWVVNASAPQNDLVSPPRRIDITMRNKTVSVRVDGTNVTTGTITRLPAEGTFGFTAASGAFNARLAIGDVRAKFYRCNAP